MGSLPGPVHEELLGSGEGKGDRKGKMEEKKKGGDREHREERREGGRTLGN